MKILMTWHWRTVTRMFENIVRIYKRVTYPFKRVLSMVEHPRETVLNPIKYSS